MRARRAEMRASVRVRVECTMARLRLQLRVVRVVQLVREG